MGLKVICILILLSVGNAFGESPGVLQAVPATPAQPSPVTAINAPAPKPFPTPVSGVLKMKDLYRVAMEAYKEKDYDKAERYLKTAVDWKDKYTPRYYYAEAHAMLGVIYHKFLPVPNYRVLAREHYLEALRIDPKTTIAERNLKSLEKVQAPRNRRGTN